MYELVRGFLLGTAERIQQGRVVCVGVTKHSYYVERYRLAGLLGNRHTTTRGDELDDATTDTLRVYHFCGVDDMLIQQVLAYGYRHQGSRPYQVRSCDIGVLQEVATLWSHYRSHECHGQD